MKARRFTLAMFWSLLLAGIAGAGFPAAAQTKEQAPEKEDHSAHQPARALPRENEAARKYFTDVVLVNQDGQEMRLYSDLLKGKVVVINAFFTTCTGVCPPMNRNIEKMQEFLGDRLGTAVHLISISVDPVTDTPPKLKEYARRFHAQPGWYFLTGKKENVDAALRKLGQYVQAREDHTSIIIIGNEATGLWKKALGVARTPELIKILQSVVEDQGTTATKHQQ